MPKKYRKTPRKRGRKKGGSYVGGRRRKRTGGSYSGGKGYLKAYRERQRNYGKRLTATPKLAAYRKHMKEAIPALMKRFNIKQQEAMVEAAKNWKSGLSKNFAASGRPRRMRIRRW